MDPSEPADPDMLDVPGGPDPLETIVIGPDELGMVPRREAEKAGGSNRGSSALTFAVLLLASILGSVAILPFSRSLMMQATKPLANGRVGPAIPPNIMPAVLAVSVVFESILSVGAIAVGLWLGESVGLGTPRLRRLLSGDREAGRELARSILPAVAIGLIMGLMLLALTATGQKAGVEPGGNPKLVMPSPGEGLLASVGAGIREEVWLRLGLMTFLAWLGAAMLGPRKPRQPAPAGVIWAANVLASLAFGAMHLPQAAMLIGLSAPVVLLVLVGNGLPSIVFGWLYWRKGLLAAMVAHFAFDVPLKVIAPLFHLD